MMTMNKLARALVRELERLDLSERSLIISGSIDDELILLREKDNEGFRFTVNLAMDDLNCHMSVLALIVWSELEKEEYCLGSWYFSLKRSAVEKVSELVLNKKIKSPITREEFEIIRGIVSK